MAFDQSSPRPALRRHGGKWLLAPWILEHLPPHRIYVEPYGGGASVLLRKPRSHAEVYNDLDGGVVNFFRVLQGPHAADLLRGIELTPFAREEFELAYQVSNDDVEEARRLVIRCFMGFGSDGHNRKVRTGFRADSRKSGTTPARDWQHYPEALRIVIERMRGVVIENRPALVVMAAHDGPDVVHYVDPPYLHDTRSTKSRKVGGKYHAYAHELSDDDHKELLAFLQTLQGTVVLSGYPHPLYDDALQTWRRVERQTLADGARPRTEVLWISRAADAGPLFGGAT